ncbi:hypothetical protein Flavo103_10040 [Flavobacterium collinsii]|uniref:helix-turn-helix domain-containing protein n=1 Tax=Flavobacterium collinsii TaxID=1114861 RepID=UPI0022C4A4CE|nr:helix-turn-helix domain-containing protein [Flavobacterium collinsii]GIQ57868.1 hypothetical protein Flavo103_10040 [Flavobacterium collinsii]
MSGKKSKYRHIGLQVYIFKKFSSKVALDKMLNVDCFSILIVNLGSLDMKINNRKVKLVVNDLIVVPKMAVCEVLVMSDYLQICQLSFTMEFAFENRILWSHIGYFEFFITQVSSKIFLRDKDVLLIIDLFTLINNKVLRAGTHIYKNEIILFCFNLLLYELAGLYHRSSWNIAAKYSRREKLAVQFFKILEMNCKKQHNVKYYADSLRITRDYLNKSVKEFTEKTPKQCIADAILLEAKNLLQNNHLTVLCIAEELQFSSSSSFSIFFKRHTSQSPSQYRLQLSFY